MSREVKRVALDFSWPLHKVWSGYLNPFYQHSHRCEACDGTGNSPEARHLHDQWYGNAPFHRTETGSTPFTADTPEVRLLAARNVASAPDYYMGGGMTEEAARIVEALRLARLFNRRWCHNLSADDIAALVANNRLYDFTHKVVPGQGWQPRIGGVEANTPTPDAVNRWSVLGMGHDSVNAHVCVTARCERMGVPSVCAECGGTGERWESEALRQQAEDWTKIEPPAGEGWQCWETCSEGSPISPVFDTPEALAHWLADTGASAFGGMTATYDEWFAMIGAGSSVCSMVMDESTGTMTSGVAAVTEMRARNDA
jgi:hypothetical protein